MTTPTAPEKIAPKLPEADGDFYLLSNTLSKEDNALRLKVRAFMETEVQPVINDFWSRDEFPFELCRNSSRWVSPDYLSKGTAVLAKARRQWDSS